MVPALTGISHVAVQGTRSREATPAAAAGEGADAEADEDVPLPALAPLTAKS